MTRRTLDIIFSAGALVLAGLALVLGLVLQNQANFADDYVHNQLQAQQITFTPAAGLTTDEASAQCLTDNAGQALVTGKQAECYANEYIARHLKEVNGGKTYSQTSGEARDIKDQNSPQAQELNDKVQTLFRGETLRGLLLTSYGFSIFGERAQTAAYVCFAIALVLLLAAIAGFVHATRKSADHVILSESAPEAVNA
jgi:hypothetical protein